MKTPRQPEDPILSPKRWPWTATSPWQLGGGTSATTRSSRSFSSRRAGLALDNRIGGRCSSSAPSSRHDGPWPKMHTPGGRTGARRAEWFPRDADDIRSDNSRQRQPAQVSPAVLAWEHFRTLAERRGWTVELTPRGRTKCTKDIRSVTSRGWCYLLEEHGLAKGRLRHGAEAGQRLPQERRSAARHLRRGRQARVRSPGEDRHDHARSRGQADVDRGALARHRRYTPVSFWDDQDYYLQMLVEKIDLRSLFSRICDSYRVPLANSGGWADINGRAAMMRRFAEWEAGGKQCVLLYCGDHDPGGLNISGSWFEYCGPERRGRMVARRSDHRPLRAQLRLHRGARADLDRQPGDRRRRAAGRPKTSRPRQALRPGLSAPLRRPEGRGQRPGGAPAGGAPALSRCDPALRPGMRRTLPGGIEGATRAAAPGDRRGRAGDAGP